MTKSVLFSLMFAGAASAGTPSASADPAGSTVSGPELWSWFAGASAGYLIDSEDDMYHVHFGFELPQNGSYQHSIFLEAGWTEVNESVSFSTTATPSGIGTLSSDIEIVPVTLNYKVERSFNDRLAAFVGAGLGIAFVDVDEVQQVGTTTTPAGDDDAAFAVQIFAGLVYDVTESFELYGGARWLYIDSDVNPGVLTSNPGGDFDRVEDDVLLEGGVRFNF